MQKIGICLFICAFLILGGSLSFAGELDKYAVHGFISGIVTLGFACLFIMFAAIGWQLSASK